MRIIHSIRALQAWRRNHQSKEKRIGFVPTLGALHEGHQSLIQRARRHSHTVVVSIFLNPLQFGPSEDYQRYPRTLSADTNLCRREGVDLLFIPKPDELYPNDFQTSVTVDLLTTRWEGEHRPRHFQGVVTIVTKLLNLVYPDQAFFGMKDVQQYLVIKQLVKDLNLGVRIIGCPTVREKDGLACSSRNRSLTSRGRLEASHLYQALRHGAKLIKQGNRQSRAIEKSMITRLTKATSSSSIDYLAICDSQTLEPTGKLKGKVILLGAVRVGRVRLIDNLIVQVP